MTRSFLAHPLRLVMFTLLLALSGAVINAHAAPSHGGPMMMNPGHIDHMMDMVGATTDQRTQVKAIFDAARADLRSQHEATRALSDEAMQLFAQPTVDARAAETLRQKMMAQHDRASQRLMQAMLEASRVLTPGQRQQLGQLMQQRRAMMGHAPVDAKPAN